MSVNVKTMKFPSFYCECAYRDGMRDADKMEPDNAMSYVKHGEKEPIGWDWYVRGYKARRLGLVHGASMFA